VESGLRSEPSTGMDPERLELRHIRSDPLAHVIEFLL